MNIVSKTHLEYCLKKKNSHNKTIISDDHNVVKKLIDSGTSVHSVTNDGGTALHKAAENGE